MKVHINLHNASSMRAVLSKPPPPIVLDTLLLIFLRVIYFFLARRYLLARVNPTLRDLSKPEILLPIQDESRHAAHVAGGSSSRARAGSHSTIGTIRSAGHRTPPAAAYPPLPGTSDIDYELDDDTDATSPGSSYPGSPARNDTLSLLPDAHGASSPSAPGPPIELNLLGARLRESQQRGRSTPRVLELAHGRSSATTGTKQVKRAARGLNRVSRVLFSICFAESMNLITLVVFHSLGILHSRARQVNFSISLHVLLGIILLVVPLVQCLMFTYRSRDTSATSTRSSGLSSLSFRSRMLISLIPFLLYIFLFTRIPPYITAMPAPVGPMPPGEEGQPDDAITQWSSGPEGWEGEGWLASSLGRVIVLGVLLIAGLSGIGAVVTAWDYLEQAAGAGKAPVTDADILQAERSLYRVRHDIVSKRDELNRVAAPPSGASTPTGGTSGGWMGRVFGNKADQDASTMRTELRALQEMEKDIARSLNVMKQRRKQQGFRHTVRGTVYNVLGYVFATYCVARLLMCLISLFIAPLATSNSSHAQPDDKGRGNTNGDWISLLLALGVSHLPFAKDVDVATWARGISLLLTGLLILSSLTMVLRWLGRLLRLTSQTVGAGFLLLTLGQLFATYVISLLVQLRRSLPPAPAVDTNPFALLDGATNATDASAASNTSTSAEAAVSTAAGAAGAAAAALATATAAHKDSLLRSLPDFRVFGRLFDAVFLVAALATIVYRYIAMKVAGADDVALYTALGRERG